MKQLCESHYDDFDVELTNNLVQFATNEMFKSSDSQFPASDMLIILGRGRSDQVKYVGRIWLRVVFIGDTFFITQLGMLNLFYFCVVLPNCTIFTFIKNLKIKSIFRTTNILEDCIILHNSLFCSTRTSTQDVVLFYTKQSSLNNSNLKGNKNECK